MGMAPNAVGHLLSLAGAKGFDDKITYHDYLYELMSKGGKTEPITESQWDAMCSIIGANRRPIYSSTVACAIANLMAKEDKRGINNAQS